MNRPDITICRRDLGRLDVLLGLVEPPHGKVGAFLLDEITRARIVRDHEVPSTLVTMGATVRFLDEDTGRAHVARLVYPHETGACDLGVSILTPVGAALLGLSEGQSIDYETIDGRLKTLTVLKVIGPAPDDAVPWAEDAGIGNPASEAEARHLWFA